MDKNEIGKKDLKKISGGYTSHNPDNPELYKEFKLSECEPAFRDFGAKGDITWGNDLGETIRNPRSKDDALEYDGKVWKPAFVHCGWHQAEVVWKDPDGNYLVPTGIYQNGM